MPELPEVETVRRGLAPVMEGARITRLDQRRPDLRFPLPERFRERLEGAVVTGLGRRAKYLLADLSTGEVLVMHLGMSGSFRIGRTQAAGDVVGEFHHARSKDAAHDHVVFDFEGGARITYNDPRRFGFMLLVARAELDRHPMLAPLGPEPLGNAFDAAALAAACAGRQTPVKAALLDQTVVAGVGNIYACEALHRAGISPRRKAATLATAAGEPNARCERLAAAVREVLAEAIAAGGSSISDHIQASGDLGYFQHAFRVYDREGEPCRTSGCGGTIRRIVQANRSTFFCPACQR